MNSFIILSLKVELLIRKKHKTYGNLSEMRFGYFSAIKPLA